MLNLNIFDKPKLIVLFGKCESGKSYTISYLLTEALRRKKFKFGLVFSLTANDPSIDDFKMIPKQCVFDGYNDKVLGNYIRKLKDYSTKYKKKAPPNFIVFDDIIGSLKKTDKEFIKFITTYRHTNTTVFLASQFPTAISTLARELISYAFVYRTQSEQGISALFKSIGGECDNLKHFTQVLQSATSKDYHCLLYNPKGKTFKENYMTYLAPTFKKSKKPMFKLTFGNAEKEQVQDEESEDEDS